MPFCVISHSSLSSGAYGYMFEISKTRKNLIQVFRVAYFSILFGCAAIIISMKIILTIIMWREPPHRAENPLFSNHEISISDTQYWDFLLKVKAFSFQNMKYLGSGMLLFNFWKAKLQSQIYLSRANDTISQNFNFEINVANVFGAFWSRKIEKS